MEVFAGSLKNAVIVRFGVGLGYLIFWRRCDELTINCSGALGTIIFSIGYMNVRPTCNRWPFGPGGDQFFGENPVPKSAKAIAQCPHAGANTLHALVL